jgi:hypothetical protein
MQAEGSRTVYEIHCARCRVTFPVGTRRCLHCGGRLTRDQTPQQLVFPPGLDIPGELPDEEASKRSSRISPISVLWIVAVLGVAIQRACAS